MTVNELDYMPMAGEPGNSVNISRKLAKKEKVKMVLPYSALW